MKLPQLVIFFSTVLPALAKISCMDDADRPVDWYASYKIPKTETESTSSMLGRGESYAYLTTRGYRTYNWILSEKGVLHSESILGNTLKAFYDNKKNLTYLMYNDEPAVENGKTELAEGYEIKFGHTKGVLVFDGDTGFWLIHSVPKFPSENAYSYPESGLMYGQSALCITFRTKELNEIEDFSPAAKTSLSVHYIQNGRDVRAIWKQLLFNRPHIYAKGRQESVVSSLDEDVKSLFGDNPQFVKKRPFSRITTLRSYRDVMFISFAKDAHFDEDLYGGLVAPYLRTSLFVETWRRGAGERLPPSCTTQYRVEDITFINITVFETSSRWFRSISFSSFEDHSKWAVSSDSKSHWVCVGDINRMKSQWTRGGGTVCLMAPAARAAYRSIITAAKHCE